jgi:hypothetical protein
MICRACLDELLAAETKATGGLFRNVRGWLFAGVGYFLAVTVFYKIGQLLLSIPSEFHSGGFLD